MPEAAGQPGVYSLSVTGGGFLPGDVTLTLDPAGTPVAQVVQADVSGYFSTLFVADGKAAGSYQLAASQTGYDIPIETSTTLTVPCATVTISPACSDAADGQPAAYVVTASGVGFDPGPVDLVFDPTGLAPLTTQAVADAFGVFNTTLILDGKPQGVYDLTASQSSAYGLIDQAITQFLVPCNQAIIRITPPNGPRGFVPVIEGFGFTALTTLTLQWDLGIGASQPVTVQTDETGYFRVELVVYQHDFLGLRHVTVVDPANPTLYTELAQPYLVAVAPIQPPFSADGDQQPPPDPVIFQR
jgi:hypothetical protein